MRLFITKATYANGDLIDAKTNVDEEMSMTEVVDFLRYELFCGTLSRTVSEDEINRAGSNLTDVWLEQDISEGDRDCIEKGWRKTLTITYVSEQPYKHIKQWRWLLKMLLDADRLIM